MPPTAPLLDRDLNPTDAVVRDLRKQILLKSAGLEIQEWLLQDQLLFYQYEE